MSLFDADDEVESVLFVHREISVYRVPPLESMDGYKELAADWGLENPLWKGRIRIIEKESSGVTIVLEDGTTGAPFARAPYTDDQAVQAVLDSSRYFVLKVQDPNTGNKAHIGIGFTDRAQSFDFNVALQDYKKRKEAPTKLEAGPKSTVPKVDYSLKDGQTFRINIPGGKATPFTSQSAESSSSSTSTSGAIPLLPPPPSARKR